MVCGANTTFSSDHSGLSRRQRFGIADVEHGSGNAAMLQRVDERRLVDERAPTDVAKDRLRRHCGDDARGNEADGALRLGQRHDDGIGLRDGSL